MIKLIWGEEKFLLEKYAAKIVKNFNTLDISKFDLDKDFNYKEILQSLNSTSLFGDKKVILIKDLPFLNNPKYLKKKEKDLIEKIFFYALKTENTLLLILQNTKKLSNDLFIKSLLKNTIVIHQKKISKKMLKEAVENFAKNNNFTITPSAIDLLINKSDESFSIVINELTKLKNFTKLIDGEFIEKYSLNYKKLNIFPLLNSIAKNDFVAANKEYKNLKNETDLKDNQLLILLISQLGFYKEIEVYSKILEYDYEKIQNITNENHYRIKIAMQNLNNYSDLKIERIINLLFDSLITLRTAKNNYSWFDSFYKNLSI